ncbi:MAG: ATP synthase F1 subunit gamma [Candidatus Abawacabacteria bacterium]|nr:ATP synthase F1 subunit gamma [Candidatus Abawacabacteria bacterium]
MALRDLKRRIRSVKLTRKITRAIQMISVSKMRRSQDRAQATKNYREHLITLMYQAGLNRIQPPEFPIYSPGITLSIIFTSDRGLCGSYNTNLIKYFVEANPGPNPRHHLITIGKKGFTTLKRLGYDIIASFQNFSDKPTIKDILPIVQVIKDSFIKYKVEKVVLVYQKFINTFQQTPHSTLLFPLQLPKEMKVSRTHEDVFEPTKTAVQQSLLPHYLNLILYQTLLDAIASEQSARMVAMEQASTNANDLISALTQDYNKQRQTAITTELAEIVSHNH